jgi:hypothetical protein
VVELLTAPVPEDMPGLRDRLRGNPRNPPAQLFGRD